MKKIIIFIILILTTFIGISQIHSDSVTCIPNNKLRKAIKDLEDCKIYKEELNITKNSVIVLESRLSLKDSIIKKYEIRDSISNAIFENYDKMITNQDQQIKNQKQINTLNSIKFSSLQVRKWIFTGCGLLVGILTGLLISK